MKTFMFGLLFLVVLCNMLFASAYATSIAVETSLNQDFHVVFSFSNINATVYGNLESNALMNKDTLPAALYHGMVQKGLLKVEYYSQSISFNDTTDTIVTTFNLRGPSMVNSTIDRGTSVENFRMNTEWRKFYLNITEGFTSNFTRLLTKPLSSWTNATENGVTGFHYSNIMDGVPISFALKLPSHASNVVTVEDTVTFDTPYTPSVTDQFINSPSIILIAFAIAGMIIYFYRKVR